LNFDADGVKKGTIAWLPGLLKIQSCAILMKSIALNFFQPATRYKLPIIGRDRKYTNGEKKRSGNIENNVLVL